MLSEQVQFCYAIAQGDTKRANELLPQVNLFQENDWGFSPAVFCLWAARRNPPEIIQALAEFFPTISPPTIFGPLSATDMEQTLCTVLLPHVKSSLTKLLQNIAKHVGPNELEGNSQQRFLIIACTQALNFILTHPLFYDVNSEKRHVTERIYQNIKLKTPVDWQEHPDRAKRPKSLQKILDSMLADRVLAVEDLSCSPTFLPSTSHRDRRISNLTKQLSLMQIKDSAMTKESNKTKKLNVARCIRSH